MDIEKIYSYIDHTNLKVDAKFSDIEKLCEEALKYKMASVCIAPTFVKEAREKFKDLNIATVIGFPNGYMTSKTKEFETKSILGDGATEIDYVIDITKVKNKRFEEVYSDIKNIREITKGKILKIIVETCYLAEEEKIKMCEIVTDVKADYIKTSTGFGSGGATIEDIELLKKHIGKDVKIKASGGIRTKEDIIRYIEAGCGRIGTSSAMNI